MTSFTISCSECRMQHTSACEECVVTFICDGRQGDAVVIDAAEVRALRLLGQSGLVPPLRHQRGADGAVPSWRQRDSRAGQGA